jgi:predicted polyphosphate/ATP-dependent NAD kinase
VNPVAGLGGRVGLGGTDGAELVAEALARGARPHALARAAAALRALSEAWPRDPLPELVVASGSMGAAALGDAGWQVRTAADADGVRVLETAIGDPTTAADTVRCARAMGDAGVELLLFAGGDGTARDVCTAVGESVVVLGIPAGVKIQSGAFATSAASAGRLAAAFLERPGGPTTPADVVDLDPGGTSGRGPGISPRLHGYLLVPRGRLLQGRKTPSPPSEAATAAAIAEDVVAGLAPGTRCILGPGTTVAAIAARMGVPKTLLGVDVVEAGAPVAGKPGLAGRSARLLVANASEGDLLASLALAGAGPVVIVVTPVGGQGFVLGRGNQPISPSVIRAVGAKGIIIVATPAKLAAIGGRPLVVDTGDPDLDAVLAGPARVITGYRERAVVRVAAG